MINTTQPRAVFRHFVRHHESRYDVKVAIHDALPSVKHFLRPENILSTIELADHHLDKSPKKLYLT
jgi:hypothetical protein